MKWSRGLMDKALASGAGDCGFESHRDRFYKYFFFKLFIYRNKLNTSFQMSKETEGISATLSNLYFFFLLS